MILAACPFRHAAAQDTGQEIARWKAEAQAVTIYRDNWGIPHIYGKTNADAAFGMEYAQAEDNFELVEMNYVGALGWWSRFEGPSGIYYDLRRQLYMNPVALKKEYQECPEWLRQVMQAAADGLNYYLYTHPGVHSKVIAHFEPWMELAFSEGSIGGDIETAINVPALAAFYGDNMAQAPEKLAWNPPMYHPLGSNGVAISPSITLDHHVLLLINPHVTFYFRDELQMVSDQGLDAYGAVTWGQFFIYQGFNTHDGWMHTSSDILNRSHFLETVRKHGAGYQYKYGNQWLPVTSREITIDYKTATGMAHKTITAYYTQHGPVIARVADKWLTVNVMQEHIKALIQDWERMTTTGYASFLKTMELHTNSSNDTVFADNQGNIALWDSDWIPKRSDTFNWAKPVDGSNPATAFDGILSLKETPQSVNPADGWAYNSNNWLWSASGPDSPKRQDYPSYVSGSTEESPRGYHALKLLTDSKDWTPASLAAAAYDSYLPPFAKIVPILIKDYDALPGSDPLKSKLADPMIVMRAWDYRWGVNSVATSLGVFWGAELMQQMRANPQVEQQRMWPAVYVEKLATAQQVLQAFAAAVDKLTADFGSWQTPWGQINRFQRLPGYTITGDRITPHFDDAKYSIPVPFTSSLWGSLASFGAHAYPNTKKWYGNDGNSFVCIIDFGPDKVRAWAVHVGGESGNPASPHFTDQAAQYAMGSLRTVYYYQSQLKGHIEREYHPGA
ncbi:MAG: penicillin acylase family protein [Gammaproteobacteria bacterium]|nr:penicillin acylase family protein [Gammaproteobacteria bacterium]